MGAGDDLYHPASDFLNLVRNDEVPLQGSAQGDANLALLIAFTRDADRSNRDWAMLLLAQTPCETPAVRDAFRHGVDDEDGDVRLEALIGLAMRDPAGARPLVKTLLERKSVSEMVLEAASYVADPALLPLFDAIKADIADWDDGMFGFWMNEAVACCASGVPPEWRDFTD